MSKCGHTCQVSTVPRPSNMGSFQISLANRRQHWEASSILGFEAPEQTASLGNDGRNVQGKYKPNNLGPRKSKTG
jgi:hypothetical protein